MADDVAITAGSGTAVATDEIGGRHFQRTKTTWGPDGTANDADTASGKALPVQVRSATGLIPIGEPTDAKSTATDTTSVSIVSILKQISASVQLFVFGAGTAAAAQRTTLASDDPAVASLSVIDDWDESDRAKVNLIVGQAGVAAGAGAVAATVQRMTLASDDPAVAALGAVSGAAVITDANGTIQQYLRGLVKQWIAGTLVLGAGTNLLGKVKTKFIVATGSTLTRAANQTPYSIGDAVSDNATPGSVTAKTITVADINNEPVTIERIRLVSTDTGIAAKSVRVWLYNSDPTANTGVAGGDNLAFSNKMAGFIGTLSGTFRTFSDGSVAVLVPDEGSRIIALPGSGAQTIWWQLQALDAFTPSANSTTFIPTVEGFQGAAN